MLNWAKLPAEFIKDRRITLTEFRVYAALLLSRPTEGGYREPTYEELMEWLELAKPRVSSAIAGLENLGWLRREIGNGRGKKSRYWLTSPTTDQSEEKVTELIPLSEPGKVTELIPLTNEKGYGIDTPLEPERLSISPPFTDDHSIYKRNKEERSKDREKIYTQDDEKISPPEPEKPAKKRKPILTPIPADFTISDGVRDWASRQQIHPSDLDRHFEHFVGCAEAKGYTYANWDAALKNAIRGNWAKIQPTTSTGVNHAQRPTNNNHASLRGAALKRHNDEQLDAFLRFGITPGASQTQPEIDITATAVRVE